MTRINANSTEEWSYEVGGRKPSHNLWLSAQAQVIYTLAKENRPLTRTELIEKAHITESTFYRNRYPLLKEKKIKYKGKYYALAFYEDWEDEFETVIRRHSEKFTKRTLSLQDLADKVGEPHTIIEAKAYRLAHKYGFTIGDESRPRLDARSLIGQF